MNFIQFKTLFKDFPVFSVSDIRSTDPAFDRRRLTEWKYRGYIQKVAKGLYMFSDVDITEDILFRVANILYSPSYISLETALAFYQLIPEITYGITSVSTRRTYHYNTPYHRSLNIVVTPFFSTGLTFFAGFTPYRMIFCWRKNSSAL